MIKGKKRKDDWFLYINVIISAALSMFFLILLYVKAEFEISATLILVYW